MRKVLFAVVLVLAVAACSDTKGTADGPIGKVDDSPAEVTNFPDQYPNVANKCDGHGHRIYTDTDRRFVVVVDASCPGGAR